MDKSILEKMKIIQENIAVSALKSRRKPEDILLVGASKTMSVTVIEQAIEAGITVLGENRVQELLTKYQELSARVDFHFIGALQTNKVKYLVDKVS